MWGLAALFLGAGSIVGDREVPARVLRVVADQDFALLFSLEAMLQGVQRSTLARHTRRYEKKKKRGKHKKDQSRLKEGPPEADSP